MSCDRTQREHPHAPRAAVALLALLAPLVVLTGCGEDSDGTSAGDGQSDVAEQTQEIDVRVPGGEAGEHAFEADLDGITEGPVTMHLTNDGTLDHHAVVLRLAPGETRESVLEAAASDHTGAAVLERVETYGGPNAAPPGGTSSSTQVLEAGDYLLICVIPGQDGLPHFAHGMVEEFTVEPAGNGSAGQAPAEPSDADVSLVDFGFSAPDTFEPGDTVTVTNDGDQSHELIAFRLDEGATLAEAGAALADPTAGPPPWTAAGGIGPLAPGGSASFPLPDQSGSYVFACVLPDVTGDGRPHHTLGMVAPITVG